MKALPIIVVTFFFSACASAQSFEVPGKKNPPKYGLNLRRNILTDSIWNPTITYMFPADQVKAGTQPESLVRQGMIYPLTFGNMPCIVPDTTRLGPIPNALSLHQTPPAAAIPNPLDKAGKTRYQVITAR